MHVCPKCHRATAISLCICIAVDAVQEAREACWSLPPAISACAAAVSAPPHTEFPYVPPNNLTVAVSVIASTGTTQHLAIDLLRIAPP
jgi:hypothetical protein